MAVSWKIVYYFHLSAGAAIVRWWLHGLHGFPRQMRHFLTDMSNRVEHQKRNQTATEVVAVWFRFWCSTRPSADTGTD